MSTAILMCALFFAKVIDNALSTTKTILVQRNHCILAGISLAASNFIYLCITKNVVNSDSSLALIVVSVASGVGCCLAVAVSNRLSKEKTYVNVIMSDDKAEMQSLRDFLAQHHITNTANAPVPDNEELLFEEIVGDPKVNTEAKALHCVDLVKLKAALDKLTPEELEIINALFLENHNKRGERAVAKELGIPQRTLNDRKKKILKKL